MTKKQCKETMRAAEQQMRRRFAAGCELCHRREGSKLGLTGARLEENGPLKIVCNECYWKAQPALEELERNDPIVRQMVADGVFV